MKIGALFHMYPHMHNAGAEHMAHAMLKDAVRRGHKATVVVRTQPNDGYQKFKPYEIDGVNVTTDMRALNHCDVLLTHLDRTTEAEQWCQKTHTPLVQIFHNDQRPSMTDYVDLAVYNTQWILNEQPLPVCDGVKDTMVLHPPVWADDYRVKVEPRYITLINLQKNKGVDIFYYCAEHMPDVQFLGVKGSYGEQVMPPKPLKNLTIIENQADIRNVYKNTGILMMPSAYESYGRCAVEASISGIPVIANRTQGLYEALGECGAYPMNDGDSWVAGLRNVIARYQFWSRLSASLGKAQDPAGDMDRFFTALDGMLKKYHKNGIM